MDGAGEPSNNTYISGLPLGTEKESVTALFTSVGATVVQCRIQPPRADSTDAHCLCRFSTVEEAMQIVQNFNGQTLAGHDKPLMIRFANKPNKGVDKGMGKGCYGAAEGGWQGQGGGMSATMGGPYGAVGGDDLSTLYVMGLPADSTDDMIREFFADFGTCLQAKLLKANDHAGGKRAACIQYDSVETAKKVMAQLDNQTLQGMAEPIRVKLWNKGGGKGSLDGKGGCKGNQMMGGKGGKGGNGIQEILDGLLAVGAFPGGNGYQNNDQACLYVCGLPPDTTDFHFYRIFSPFGSIAPKGIRVMLNEEGACKGIGFVNFLEAQAAHNAISILDGCELPDGTLMKVSIKQAKDGKGFSGGKGPGQGQDSMLGQAWGNGKGW